MSHGVWVGPSNRRWRLAKRVNLIFPHSHPLEMNDRFTIASPIAKPIEIAALIGVKPSRSAPAIWNRNITDDIRPGELAEAMA